MTRAQLQKLHPDLRVAANKGGEKIELERLVLQNQGFGSLEGCRKEFWLHRDELWQVMLMCPAHPPEEIRGALEGHFGAPTEVRRGSVRWRRPPIEITLKESSGFFTIADRERGEAFAEAAMAHARGR